MEASTSGTSRDDVDIGDLERLLDVFGSVFSLEDIASAYCQAKRNVDMAGEILFALHGSSSISGTDASLNKLKGSRATSSELSYKTDNASATSSKLSADSVPQTSYGGERHTKASKPKKCSASIGSVSGVIGKEYVRPRSLTNESCEASKPIKIDSVELPVSEICPQEIQPIMTSRNNTMHIDVEEFLFKMLGDGFQLDINVIREVLGLCGYDVQKGMEKLLDLSASKLDKCDDVIDMACEKSTKKCPDLRSILHQEELQHLHSAQSDGTGFMTRNLTESPQIDKDRFDLQKEVLEALFNVPERTKEAPRRMRAVREVRRSRAFGKLVDQPLSDTTSEPKTLAAEPRVTTDEDEDDEDNYDVLRKAVKEYWVTMKEYYKDAVDAFAKGEHALADKLLEQGNFFKKKAQEADERSAQKLIEPSCTDDEVPLDLRVHEPKDAICLLRLHLTSLSGIPGAIKNLRVIVGTNDEDPKGNRRRRVTKLLEKESIKWTEGNGKTILIRADLIDPKRLSFAKDKVN